MLRQTSSAVPSGQPDARPHQLVAGCLSDQLAVLDSLAAVVHVVEVRRLLEGEMVALAAERATRAQVATMRRALKALDRAAAAGQDGVLEDLASIDSSELLPVLTCCLT